MKNRYCKTCREFSWSDFINDGVSCCCPVSSGFKDNVMPTDNANNCNSYSFNKYWQEGALTARIL